MEAMGQTPCLYARRAQVHVFMQKGPKSTNFIYLLHRHGNRKGDRVWWIKDVSQ